MQEIGVGLVNVQAAEIKDLTYPAWALEKSWTVLGTDGSQDDQGYDLYRLERYGESMIVPANRLVLMKRLLERIAKQNR